MRKVLILVVAGLMLSACEVCSYKDTVDRKVQAELFDKCLARAAEARKGVSYTTNDDEDYDDVIAQCHRSTYSMAVTDRVMECK